MTKKITFFPCSEESYSFVEAPVPAKKLIPEWYKESTTFYNSNSLEIGNNYSPNLTFKSCIPILDSISSGYIQKTWCDIYIKENNGEVLFSYSSSPEIIKMRDKRSIKGMPILEGFCDVPLNWIRPWGFKTPKGYSLLITHPFYRDDLPFRVVSGIIDSDYFFGGQGQVAFFIKKGFDGVIPLGTPMFQILPIKREMWKSEIKEYKKYEDIEKQGFDVRKVFYGGYKKYYWRKKFYE